MSGPVQIKDRRTHPFCIVETPVLMDSGLSTHDKMIYVVLCSFASARNRECYPSVATIAKRASCSERQVRRSLTVLEERRYIEREFALGHATTYGILDLPETPATQSGVTEVQDTPAPLSGEGGTTVRHNKKYLTRGTEQEKDNPPSEGLAEPAEPAQEPGNGFETKYPVSEVPEVMRPTAEYLLLKTGRKDMSLTESELSALRALNAKHYPAVVQRQIDIAVERFTRTGRDLRSLNFVYISEMLQNRKPTLKSNSTPGPRDAPPAAKRNYSDLVM